MTYAEEAKIKAAEKAKRSRKYRYEPTVFDKVICPTPVAEGSLVVKVQPHGCPKNGTMGMCYVGDAETGAFLGMVCEGSLAPAREARA